MKTNYQSIFKIFGYDVALAHLKFSYNFTWSQAIKLASDYGGGGVH